MKQSLNDGLFLKKVHRVIKFDQKPWLQPYIDMNTELRKNAKTDFEKYFFKLMSNAFFRKTMENGVNHINIKLVTTKEKENSLDPIF